LSEHPDGCDNLLPLFTTCVMNSSVCQNTNKLKNLQLQSQTEINFWTSLPSSHRVV